MIVPNDGKDMVFPQLMEKNGGHLRRHHGTDVLDFAASS
jgi:hypothetical protein